MCKLTLLFNCNFREGRAESAPFTRTGHTDKVSIAQADRTWGGAIGSVPDDKLLMPHIGFTDAEIEKRHPSLIATPDLELDDLSKLQDEKLYSASMDVVQPILQEMAVIGGRPRAPKAGGPAGGPASQVVGAVQVTARAKYCCTTSENRRQPCWLRRFLSGPLGQRMPCCSACL